jgi:hypothetical protein
MATPADTARQTGMSWEVACCGGNFMPDKALPVFRLSGCVLLTTPKRQKIAGWRRVFADTPGRVVRQACGCADFHLVRFLIYGGAARGHGPAADLAGCLHGALPLGMDQ